MLNTGLYSKRISLSIRMLGSNFMFFQLELLLPSTRDIALEPRSSSSKNTHERLHSNQNTNQDKPGPSVHTITIEAMGDRSSISTCFPFAGPALECLILAESSRVA